jgi:hypothetical protein
MVHAGGMRSMHRIPMPYDILLLIWFLALIATTYFKTKRNNLLDMNVVYSLKILYTH